ncbi:MAG: lstR [Gemmatimonadetes bacterium]|nr:lstR [Gemmatimonadota bacterium]
MNGGHGEGGFRGFPGGFTVFGRRHGRHGCGRLAMELAPWLAEAFGGPHPAEEGEEAELGRRGFGPGGPGAGPFGGAWFGFGPFGPGGPGGPGRPGGPRFRRGDIKFVLLELIADKPRHGYDIIKELEARHEGFYKPSPGTVYPTLQMLEEGGYLTSDTVDGKRVYTITDAGRKLLEERTEKDAGEAEEGGPGGFAGFGFGPFPRGGHRHLGELRDGVRDLMGAVMQAARHGSPEKTEKVREALERARREIYALLAE